MKHTKLVCGTLAGLALFVGSGHAAVVAYTPDANTINLWHFDEASGTTAVDATATNNLAAGGGATLGSTGFTGFGNAGNTTAASNSGFQTASRTVASMTSASGAFTFEALINLTVASGGQRILAMDNNSTNPNRPFLFNLSNGGADITFANIGGASVNNYNSAIPVAGDHVFVANEWFHVAVTYNGSEGTADNLKVYWTRVDSGATEANLVGSFNMSADLSGSASILGVGNDYRTAGTGNSNNLEGLIDEVRISNIARGAGDFIFTIPEPSTTVLLGLGGLALILRRRK